LKLEAIRVQILRRIQMKIQIYQLLLECALVAAL